MGIETYQQTQIRTESPRSAEYRQLAILTASLEAAKEKTVNAKQWATAIVNNQHFWSRLRIHVLNANTSLPEQMRLQFIALAQWVEKESALVANGEGDIQNLIAINQQIMEGLRPYTGSIAEDSLKVAS